MSSSSLPIIASDSGLARYLAEIRRFPMLQPQEEFMLAKSWRDHGDTEAAHRLVTSHLRLVAKIAMGYRGYGLPIGEVISEGNVGLMQAVKRFEPEKGFRLATYAMWWIKAAIQVSRQNGDNCEPKEVVFQPSQGKKPDFSAWRGRFASGTGRNDRNQAWRSRAGSDRDEPPVGWRFIVEFAGAKRWWWR